MNDGGDHRALNLDAFATDAARLLGAAHVDFTAAAIADLGRATTPWRVPALGVVRPVATTEVAELLRLAARHGVTLSPVSTGKNWGYGDRQPAGPGQVVLDLGRMNRIVEVDEELAYAVIEPGVTQGQLFEHMRGRGLKLWMDCTGAGPDAGIVGNILERGFGHTPLGDRFRAVSGLEVVLADGSVLDTGFTGLAGAAVGPLYPYGLGPVLDGLFSQSNLGVVTRMGVWLMPQPPAFAAAVAFVDDAAALAGVVDRLRPLRLDGTLPSVVHIGNDLRLLSGRMAFPGRGSHLTADERRHWQRIGGATAWAFTAGLYGNRRQIAANYRRLKDALAGLSVRPRLVSDRLLATGGKVAAALARLRLAAGFREQMHDAAAAIGLLKGQPTRHFLKGAYWRHGGGATGHDPAADGCGLLWLAPVTPHRGKDIDRATGLIEQQMARHGFDPLMTLSLLNGRAVAVVTTIAFDMADDDARRRAERCYHDLWSALVAAGYPPYRAAGGQVDGLAGDLAGYWQAVRRLKSALDPAGILAPGRYLPR